MIKLINLLLFVGLLNPLKADLAPKLLERLKEVDLIILADSSAPVKKLNILKIEKDVDFSEVDWIDNIMVKRGPCLVMKTRKKMGMTILPIRAGAFVYNGVEVKVVEFSKNLNIDSRELSSIFTDL